MSAALKCSECGKPESWPSHDEKNWAGDNIVDGAHPFEAVIASDSEAIAKKITPPAAWNSKRETKPEPEPVKLLCTTCGKERTFHRGRGTHRFTHPNAPATLKPSRAKKLEPDALDLRNDPKIFPTKKNKAAAKRAAKKARDPKPVSIDKKIVSITALIELKRDLEAQLDNVLTQLKEMVA